MAPNGMTAPRKDSEVNGSVEGETVCPNCKSSKRTTPNIRFKINTKCYHRICEGCVDRVFVNGKATCPIPSCNKEIWKKEWRTPTFEDLQIEREVDVRKRVMAILNRGEDEFETKRAWDDFLELREEMIMNLALGTDIAATNRKLKAYEQANAASIKANATQSSAFSGPVDVSFGVDNSGLVKGLQKITAPPPVKRYDPFMGMPRKRDYYEVRPDYPSRRLAKAKVDVTTLTGGFDFQQYYDESLLRAFAGLGCFIEDEKAVYEKDSAASAALRATSSDDVF